MWYLLFIYKFVNTTLVIFSLFLMIIINLLKPNKLRLISTIVWLPSTLLALKYVSVIVWVSFYVIYSTCLYLRLRFRQVSSSLQNNGRGNCNLELHINLFNYPLNSNLNGIYFFRQRAEDFNQDYRIQSS